MWLYNYTQQSDELYHYGVLGMKWGQRKSPNSYGGSITKSGKYKASNGVVIAKSKNPAVAAMRRFGTSVPGRALSAAGRSQMAKATGRSKESLKNQEKREREALKEYYKVGGDRMLKRATKDHFKPITTSRNTSKGKEFIDRLGKHRLEELLNKDGYQKHRKFTGTITDGYREHKKPGAVKY